VKTNEAKGRAAVPELESSEENDMSRINHQGPLRWAALSLLLVLSVGLVFPAGAADVPQELDGLKLVHNTSERQVYVRPGVNFKQFDKAFVVDVFVQFQKNWLRQHNEQDVFLMNQKEVLEIKQKVGAEFMKRFPAQLEKHGLGLVTRSQPGPNVVVIRPAIVNLEVNAPNPMAQENQGETFMASAGQATLFAELYDSVSSQLIARILAAGVDEDFGGFMPASGVTNKAAEDRIIDRWASELAEHLGRLPGSD